MSFVGAIEIGFENAQNKTWVRSGNGRIVEVTGMEIYDHYKIPLPISITSLHTA